MLFTDTSLWLKYWKLSCHDFSVLADESLTLYIIQIAHLIKKADRQIHSLEKGIFKVYVVYRNLPSICKVLGSTLLNK